MESWAFGEERFTLEIFIYLGKFAAMIGKEFKMKY